MKVLLIIALVALVIWLAIAIIVATDLIIDMFPKTRFAKTMRDVPDDLVSKFKQNK